MSLEVKVIAGAVALAIAYTYIKNVITWLKLGKSVENLNNLKREEVKLQELLDSDKQAIAEAYQKEASKSSEEIKDTFENNMKGH